MFRILFLCTGNSGRSIMASEFSKKFAPGGVEIIAASDKNNKLQKQAIKVMEESGCLFPFCRLPANSRPFRLCGRRFGFVLHDRLVPPFSRALRVILLATFFLCPICWNLCYDNIVHEYKEARYLFLEL